MRKALRIAALCCVLAGSLLAACSGVDRVEPGEVVAARTAAATGQHVEVGLPNGSVRVTIGERLDLLHGDQVVDGVARRSPRGAEFWSLSWYHREVDTGHWMYDASNPAELAVVIDGDRSEIGPTHTGESTTGEAHHGGVFIAVGAEAEAVHLELDYDGHAQVVDLTTGELIAGAVAPAPGEREVLAGGECPREGWRDPGAEEWELHVVACQVHAAEVVSYAPGHGWARPGRAWLGLSVGVDAELAVRDSRARDGSDVAGLRRLTVMPRLAGEEPTAGVGDGGRIHLFDIAYPLEEPLVLDFLLEVVVVDGPTLRWESPGPAWTYD